MHLEYSSKRMRFFGAVSVTDIYQPYKNEDDEEVLQKNMI